MVFWLAIAGSSAARLQGDDLAKEGFRRAISKYLTQICLMPSVDIDFEWFKYSNGYEFDDYRSPTRLRPKKGTLIKYEPLEHDPTFVLNAFANIKTPDNLLRFYSNYGPLTGATIDLPQFEKDEGYRPLLQISADSDGESFADAMYAVHWFRNVLERKTDKERIRAVLSARAAPLRLATARLRVDFDGNVRIVLTPRTLLHGLRLYLGMSLTDAKSLKNCAHCGVLFSVGPGTGRKQGAMYCSTECQKQFNNAKRTNTTATRNVSARRPRAKARRRATG